MQLVRNLRVVSAPQGDEGRSIVAAFATSDGLHVDQHLAVATQFVVYAVSKTTARPIEIGEFATKAAGNKEGKLAEKLRWLRHSDVVYAVAVGSSASTQLMARGVLPLRTAYGSTIESLLLALQEELDEMVAGFLEQVRHFKEQIGSTSLIDEVERIEETE